MIFLTIEQIIAITDLVQEDMRDYTGYDQLIVEPQTNADGKMRWCSPYIDDVEVVTQETVDYFSASVNRAIESVTKLYKG